MKKILLIILASGVSCSPPPKEGFSTSNVIVGELYFDQYSQYYKDVDINTIKTWESNLLKIKSDNFTGHFKQRILNQQRLLEAGLLYEPYIELITKDDTIFAVVLSPKDYKAFKLFDKMELQRRGQKILVTIEGEKERLTVIKGERVVKIEQKTGVTLDPGQDMVFPEVDR